MVTTAPFLKKFLFSCFSPVILILTLPLWLAGKGLGGGRWNVLDAIFKEMLTLRVLQMPPSSSTGSLINQQLSRLGLGSLPWSAQLASLGDFT